MPDDELPRLSRQIDLNVASEEELAAVPVIGPQHAHDIVEYRNEHGAFDSFDDLARVPGFDREEMDRLRDALSAEARVR